MSSQRPSQTQASDALIPALVLFGGLTLLLIGLLAARPNVIPAKTAGATASPVAAAVAEATEASQTVALALDPAKVTAGENSFQGTCSACHGFNAMGIPGLGKPLIGSKFVNGLTDDQLLAFLQKGREVTDPLNTTGVMMPARGGNPNFTDDKLVEIIAYIRSLNAPTNQAAMAAAPTTEVPTSSAPVATDVPYVFAPLDLSGLPVPTSDVGNSGTQPVVTGQSLYVQSCSGCHGVDGNGVERIAGSLSTSTLLGNKDGIGLFNFLTKAGPPTSPLDHFPHPNRGGYPQLSDADLQSIIAYLYSLPTGK